MSRDHPVISFRATPELEAKLRYEAESWGMSLNRWAIEAIKESLRYHWTPPYDWSTGNTVNCSLRLDPILLERIDIARGTRPRANYVRAILTAAAGLANGEPTE